jgi:hypothetical protein
MADLMADLMVDLMADLGSRWALQRVGPTKGSFHAVHRISATHKRYINLDDPAYGGAYSVSFGLSSIAPRWRQISIKTVSQASKGRI